MQMHRASSPMRSKLLLAPTTTTGHDPRCQADPAWIEQMRVDMLPGGREQPFYSVLVDTRDRPGAQTTYVAQVMERAVVERHWCRSGSGGLGT